MRVISFIFVFDALISLNVSSQISIFVDNTYQHEIVADSLSGRKAIINQKTFDTDATKLLFETNYDFKSTLEKNIIAYFYDSLNRMISKEIQTVDRVPIELSQISYGKNDDTSCIKIFTPVDDTVTVSKIKYFSYDDQKRLKEVNVFYGQEKLLERQVLFYKKDEVNPSSEKIYRYDQGSCRQKYVYTFSDTAGLLMKTRISDGCNVLPYKKYTLTYEYNPKNKITAEKLILNRKHIVRKRVYEYNNDIELSTFYDVDNNKITAFYSRTYFWHKVSFLNVKSYFE
jgi:hypothetical protein